MQNKTFLNYCLLFICNIRLTITNSMYRWQGMCHLLVWVKCSIMCEIAQGFFLLCHHLISCCFGLWPFYLLIPSKRGSSCQAFISFMLLLLLFLCSRMICHIILLSSLLPEKSISSGCLSSRSLKCVICKKGLNPFGHVANYSQSSN